MAKMFSPVTDFNLDMPTFTRTALQTVGWKRPVFVLPPAVIRMADGLISLLSFLHLNPGLRPLSAINVDKIYSTEKIRLEMDWAPSYSLIQSLKDTLRSETT